MESGMKATMRKPALLIAIWLAATSPAAADLDDIIDSPMYQAPKLPVPAAVIVLPDRAKELWLRALERPEIEMRYRAAEAIALAHRRGVKGMETTSAALRAAFDRPDQHATVRLALADALLALDLRAAAPSLFQQAQAGGIDLRAIVEPALAKWNHGPARGVAGTPARSGDTRAQSGVGDSELGRRSR
jgi:glycine/D-amino acid oxidase-like deaminating enzyme